MPIYRTTGVLTSTIAPENVAAAQRYLTHDHEGEPINMEQYLDPPLKGLVESLEWRLDGDGHSWSVTAYVPRELTDDELKQLAGEVSGQNSDGLGESFEQQDFAWDSDEGYEEECSDCEGRGELESYDEDEERTGTWETCGSCDGGGYLEHDDSSGRMISFDWQTNDCKFERVK